MTSNHHGPYVLGYTRATMAITKSCNTAMLSESQKDSLSSDCGLQPAHMKSELLVIPNQHVGVNAFPMRSRVLYTPPVKPWELGVPKVSVLTARRELPKVIPMTGVKS